MNDRRIIGSLRFSDLSVRAQALKISLQIFCFKGPKMARIHATPKMFRSALQGLCEKCFVSEAQIGILESMIKLFWASCFESP